MPYNKATQKEWQTLQAYLEDEFFLAPIPGLAKKHLQKQHKKYTFKQMLSFFIHYKAEILHGVKDTHHLSNKLNWYLENKMADFLAEEKKHQATEQPTTAFKFITYHQTPTPPPPNYDIL